MLAIDCNSCGGPTLIGYDHITSVSGRDGLMVVSFRCWCGTEGSVATGSRALLTNQAMALSAGSGPA